MSRTSRANKNGLRNLRKDLLVPAVSRRAQKGSTRTQGRQEDKRTQAASRNRECRQGTVSKKTQNSPISFWRDLIVDTTRKDAQGAPRACTTSCTTWAPEQGRANPCRRRTVSAAAFPHLPSLPSPILFMYVPNLDKKGANLISPFFYLNLVRTSL